MSNSDIGIVNGVIISVVIILVAILIVWCISTANRLKRYQIKITESKKDADIALAKRYSTVSNMLKIARSYAKHELTLMTNLVVVRQGGSIADTNAAVRSQNNALRNIWAVGENYPNMLSSEQFLNLQNAVKDENSEYAAAKKIVNSNIGILNQEIVSFPVSIVAAVHGIRKMEFLEEPEENGKEINDLDYEL